MKELTSKGHDLVELLLGVEVLFEFVSRDIHHASTVVDRLLLRLGTRISTGTNTDITRHVELEGRVASDAWCEGRGDSMGPVVVTLLELKED